MKNNACPALSSTLPPRDILHEMVECASQGDRECHIVILLADDAIDWDEDYPPPMGDGDTQTIKSTPMYR